MNIKSVYRAFEENNIPQQKVTRDDKGRIESTITRSQRGDVIVTEHLKNDLYKAIRVMPKFQSRSSAIQDMIKNPRVNYNEDFEYCKYQLLNFNCERFRNKNAHFNHLWIHKKCNWNSKQATRLNTARSARSLENAWNRYL